MTDLILADSDPHRICRMAAEHVNLELLEAQDRVRQLENHQAILNEIATLGIHRSYQSHIEKKRLKGELLDARSEIRDLRELLNRATETISDEPTNFRPLPPIESDWLHQ